MAQLPQPFNAQSVQPATADGSAAQLPIGEHPCVIKSSEVREVKDNNQAAYLQLNLEVIDGPHKGATGIYRLNIYSDKPEARNIAYRQLSSLCYAVGQFQVQDSTQLHDKPFIVVVKPQSDPKYTQVTGVLDIQGRDPGKAVQGQAPAPAQAPSAPYTPPATAVQPAAPSASPPAGWAPAAASAPAQAPAGGGWNPGGAAPGGAAPWGAR